jgi:hypothetical protein
VVRRTFVRETRPVREQVLSIRVRRFVASLSLGAACVVACGGSGPDPELGELGRARFSYQRSCFFGCPLDQPLLSGTREAIAVTGDGDAHGVTAESSAPDVAQFAVERDCFCARNDDLGGRVEVAEDAACDAPRVKHCDNRVLVQAGSAGDATLQLNTAAGQAIDRTTVSVRTANRARFRGTLASKLGAIEATAFQIDVGDTLGLELTLYDERGRKLLAPEGVHWSSSAVDVASVEAFLQAGGAELDAGLDVVINPHAEGEAEIGVDVPGLSTSVQLTVSAP